MKSRGLFLGFGFIGICCLGLATFLGTHLASEARIGERLIEDGIAVQAEVIEAEFVERLSCTGSTIKSCRRSDYALGTITYPTGAGQTVNQITLSQAEFEAHEAGERVTFDLVYLPGDVLEIEDRRGDRYTSVDGFAWMPVVILCVFGLIFGGIGAVGMMIGQRTAREA
jgi:hypothetical protein